MARRLDALIPLSHDHHLALAQARRLKEAAEVTDQPRRARMADDFINFYLGRLLNHFREEEELFFAPIVDIEAAHGKVMRALAEHLQVHAAAHALMRQVGKGEADPEILARLSQMLTAHVRFEEKELFPLVEELVGEAGLADLAEARRTV